MVERSNIRKMASPTIFDAANTLWKGNGETVSDLHTFTAGGLILSRWQPSPAEVREILGREEIWLSVLTRKLPPVYLGSRSELLKIYPVLGDII